MIRHLEGKHPIKNVIWRNSHAGSRWHAGPAEIQHCWIPNTRIRATARGPGHMEREHWLTTGWILGGSTRPASARAPDKNPRIWKGGLTDAVHGGCVGWMELWRHPDTRPPCSVN